MIKDAFSERVEKIEKEFSAQIIFKEILAAESQGSPAFSSVKAMQVGQNEWPSLDPGTRRTFMMVSPPGIVC